MINVHHKAYDFIFVRDKIFYARPYDESGNRKKFILFHVKNWILNRFVAFEMILILGLMISYRRIISENNAGWLQSEFYRSPREESHLGSTMKLVSTVTITWGALERISRGSG